MRSRIVGSVALAVGIVVVPASADERVVAAGAYVRVAQPGTSAREGREVEGRVASVDDDRMVVRTRDEGDVTVRWTDVRTLEVATRRSRGCGALRGAGLGLLIGAGLGAAMGASQDPPSWSRSADVTLGAASFGFFGLGLGAISGLSVPCTTWQAAEDRRITLHAEPVRGGVGARVSLRF